MGHMFKTLFSKTVAETCVWCHPTLLTYGNYIRIAGKELKELWCYLEKRPELEEWAGEADDAFTCHFTPLFGLNLLFLITLSVLTFKHREKYWGRTRVRLIALNLGSDFQNFLNLEIEGPVNLKTFVLWNLSMQSRSWPVSGHADPDSLRGN